MGDHQERHVHEHRRKRKRSVPERLLPLPLDLLGEAATSILKVRSSKEFGGRNGLGEPGQRPANIQQPFQAREVLTLL
jgi:hypothetical protein